MSEIETNSVYGGRTGMDTRLSLTQDILYMDTESSLRRLTFLIEINIYPMGNKNYLRIPRKFSGPLNFEEIPITNPTREKSNLRIGNTAETFAFEQISYHQPLDHGPHRLLQNKIQIKSERKKIILKSRIEHI